MTAQRGPKVHPSWAPGKDCKSWTSLLSATRACPAVKSHVPSSICPDSVFFTSSLPDNQAENLQFQLLKLFFSGFFQLSSFSTVNKTKLKHKKSTQWLEWLKQQWYWQESKATKASRDWLKKHKNAATTLQNYFTVSHRILTQNFTSANIYSRNRGCAHKKSWWMFKKSWWMTKFSTIQVWVNKRMKF